ncbi:MAG: hypothetical protein HN509_03950 [Halobacteriovoraceae bacterium]|jgi:hypothetical protein|nr:hypothetical protein [Halobacteriovoraceae bacterium]
MKAFRFTILVLTLLSAEAYGFGTGYSSYPLAPNKRLLSAEFTGVTSVGGGVGVQGRYTQKVNKQVSVDAGLGISGGKRTSRLFLGADYMIIPDYSKQPRISVKGTIMNAKDFGQRRNSIAFAPTISKGFSFWGTEGFPFLSLPYGVHLNSDNNSYETTLNANLGMTGNLPIEGYRHLTGSIEGSIDLKDSYTGIFASVTFPLN